jgi:hypothetical protein
VTREGEFFLPGSETFIGLPQNIVTSWGTARRNFSYSASMLKEIRHDAETARPFRHSHPHPTQLERFMRGQLPELVVRYIVRHLLTGCPSCLEVTRRLWVLADGDPALLEDRK